MFQSLGASYGAVFGNVPDEKNRYMIFFRPEQKLRSHLTHLPNAAGRHLEFFAERGLNGIDDHGLGLQMLGRRENSLDRHLRVDVQARCANRKPLTSQLDLVRGFLTRCIKNDE